MAVLATSVVGAVAPGVAQAHHVANGFAKCELVANVPTITASADFVYFASYNKPINGTLKVDATTVQTVTGFTFAGSTGHWDSDAINTTAGDHHVSAAFSWPNQNGANGSFSADVHCPAPVPPPPTPPTPATPPTPPTPSATPPAPLPVPATHAEGAVLGETDSGACVPQKLGTYAITVTPKGAKHGLVTFHLQGKGATNVRWYVDTRRAAKHTTTWEWTRANGRHYSIYLWAQKRWGQHLWGRHTIEAKFTVKDSCGTARAVRITKLYFNHDPLPNDPIFAH